MYSDASIIIGLIMLGGIIGSFLNMLIYRLPRDMDTVFKPSHCPQCERRLRIQELIPVLSYVVQLGKCRFCKQKIPYSYLLVELVAIGVAVVSFWGFQAPLLVLKSVIFFWGMIVLFMTDLRHYYLPDRITLSLLVLGGVWAVVLGQVNDAAFGMIAGGGIYLLILLIGRLIYRKPVMGLGDVKLGAAIGAYWGLQAALITCYLSFILGGLAGVFLILSKQKKRSDEIPFGPFIILACVIALIFGGYIRNVFLS